MTYTTEEMQKTVIPNHLKDVENKNNVKILLAVESGSRAWGFESKNSDWDVRFIYVHKPEWYLTVNPQRDVIEHMYPDDVDLAGWELRKALALLQKSNPSLIEWFHSPIVYYQDEAFAQSILSIEKDYFNPISTMYHYNSIANKHNARYLEKEGAPMKPFLYFLRGILACRWIEMHKSVPPVRFQKLMEATVTESDIKQKIYELIAIKKEAKEYDIQSIDKQLVNYAKELAAHFDQTISSFRPEQSRASAAALDRILFNTVMNNA